MAAGWTSSSGTDTAQWYRDFGEREVHGVSPSYEALCLGVAGDVEVLARLDELPTPKRQPNLLLASVRFLGGPVRSWAQFREFLLDRWDDLVATMLQRRTQTNEARRCTGLLPVLAALPQPLALLEVGASAGLCLFPDRWTYRYTSDAGPHVVGHGPQLRCRVAGTAPLPDRLPDVVWRAGLDLNPLDVADPEDVRWLESLVWPEERSRFDVLRDAVAIARSESPRITRGDLTTDLATVAADAPAGATLVVFHTAVLAYVDEPGREVFAHAVADLGARRPTCWLSNEAPGVVAASPRPTARTFVLAEDGTPLALTGGHGDTLEWFDRKDAA